MKMRLTIRLSGGGGECANTPTPLQKLGTLKFKVGKHFICKLTLGNEQKAKHSTAA